MHMARQLRAGRHSRPRERSFNILTGEKQSVEEQQQQQEQQRQYLRPFQPQQEEKTIAGKEVAPELYDRVFEEEVQREVENMRAQLQAPAAGAYVKKSTKQPQRGAQADSSADRKGYLPSVLPGMGPEVSTAAPARPPAKFTAARLRAVGNDGGAKAFSSLAAAADPAYVQALQSRVAFLEKDNVDLSAKFERYKTDVSARFASLERTVENRIFDEVQKRWQMLIEKGNSFQARALPGGGNQQQERAQEAVEGFSSSSSFAKMEDIDDLREAVLALRANIRVLEARPQLDSESATAAAINGATQAGLEAIEPTLALAQNLDADMSRLKVAIKEMSEEETDFRVKERRKGAVLFGEVVKLGEALEASSLKATRALHLLEQRLREAEVSSQRLNGEVENVDSRSAGRFLSIQQRAQELEVKIAGLTEEVIRHRASQSAEQTERARIEEAQMRIAEDLRNNILRVDTNAAEKLAAIMAAQSERIAELRGETQRKLEALAHEATLRAQSEQEIALNAKEETSRRFREMEVEMKRGFEDRDNQVQDLARDTEARMQLAATELKQEATARAKTDQQLTEDIGGGIVRLASAVEQNEEKHSRDKKAIEGVLRTEIKARMRRDKKFKEERVAMAEQLGKAVEMVRAEAREERRSIQTGVEKKHKQVDEKMKEIREDVKQTMERAAQGQALVNADTNARVEALEERELSAEDEYKHEIEALGKKIEKYATSSADATSALQMVVQSNRRGWEEAVETTRVRAAADNEVLGLALQDIVSTYAQDNQAEIDKYRAERDAAVAAIRTRMRHDRQAAERLVAEARKEFQAKHDRLAVCERLDWLVNTVVEEGTRVEIEKTRAEARDLVAASDRKLNFLGDRLEKQRDFDVAAQGKTNRVLQEQNNRLRATDERIEKALATETAQRVAAREWDNKHNAEALENVRSELAASIATVDEEHTATASKVALESTMSRTYELAKREEREGDLASMAKSNEDLRKLLEDLRAEVQREKEVAAELQGRIQGVIDAVLEEKELANKKWVESQEVAKAFIEDEKKELAGLEDPEKKPLYTQASHSGPRTRTVDFGAI